MDEVAISVKAVSKDFSLPHDRARSVKEVFVNPFRTSMHKNVDVQHALRNVSVDIKRGEFFGIVGRNGSGKSTLLKMLAGIYQPTKGSIRTSGKLVPFIELGVGFNPELTGRQNVYLNGALLGFSEKEIAAKYQDIVEFAELEEFMEQKLKNYSSGMQVRLAFSMAVRAEANILLIDEVLAVGDADFQRKCFEYFNQLKKTKKTVVFVSHDMDAVQRYCDRAMLIEKSKLVDIGETGKIAEQYLKLFNDQSGSSDGTDEKRWGNGNLKASRVQVDIDKSKVTIKQKVKASKAVSMPTAGIRIRSSSGLAVMGTNSQVEKITLPDLKAGQTIEVTWQLPNILSDGKYLLDSALSQDNGLTITDWWDEASVLTVKKDRNIPYPVDPKFSVEVKQT